MDTEIALWEKHHKLHDKQGQARKSPDRQRKHQYH